MKFFKIAIDESGGIEPVINLKTLQPHINPDQPYSFVGAAILNGEMEEDFDNEWNALRGQIADELNLATLPPIHMRLMWGKQLPRRHGSVPNPYLTANQEQIFSWVSQALEISHEFSFDRNGLRFLMAIQERKRNAKSLMRHYKHRDFAKEIKFLYERHGKAYQSYHNVATSPLIEGLGILIFEINHFVHLHRSQGTIQIDNSQDAIGFDLLSAFQLFKERAMLSYIDGIQTLENAGLSFQDSPLTQLADVKTFLYNKHYTSNGQDRVVADFFSRWPLVSPTFNNVTINYGEFLKKQGLDIGKNVMLIRYELARKRALTSAPFFDEYLIDLEGFEQRTRNLSKTKLANGVSILKTQWQDKVKNG
jgi:hypothetical protein